MPIYKARCEQCGFVEAYVRPISFRDQIPEHCSERMTRIIEAPAVRADLPPYESPIDGRMIEGRAARREDLKRNNCREWEGMAEEKKAALERAAVADVQFEKGIERALYQTYNHMSREKQKILSGDKS